MNNIYVSFIVVFFFPLLLFSQVKNNHSEKKSSTWSIHAKYGIPLFETKQEPTFSSFETSFNLQPGVHAILGISCQYPLFQHISLGIEASYQYGQFIRLEEFSYTSFGGQFRGGTIREHFKTHSVLYPVKINYHFKKFNISVGTAFIWHFDTKVDVGKKHYLEGELLSSSITTYKDGDYFSTASPFIDISEVNLERKINIQVLFALQYRLNERLLLDSEIRQNLLKNRLTQRLDQYDVIGDLYDYFNPFPRVFSVGIYYIFY